MLRVFCPGAIVEANAIGAGYFEAERDDRSSDARAAGRRDRLLQIYALGLEYLMKLLDGLQTSMLDQFGEGDAGGARHVP